MSPPRLDWRLPRFFAHRCGGALTPENTLAGLRLAARLGVQAVEFDVTLSADGTPWLIHDLTLERTTTGRGAVCQTADSTLQGLDAGSAHHRAFAGETLPTLHNAAQLCRELDLRINLEIKPAPGQEEETGEVVAAAARRLWADAPRPLLSSFSERALAAVRDNAPEWPIGVLYHQPPIDWPERLDRLAAATLHCHAGCVDDPLLRLAHERQVPVLCYTVNDQATAVSLFQRGITAIFTDRIDCLPFLVG
ncbi:MAG TPA: glycerophosphodiester phosphodiesterase [Accumulibacter sp.]|nr:glycerophosphodiester phosphodiesterase [Accumulibacter sp.]HMW17177.1 glycerophosphodiester phosphodiesterase [Accumulibacter sp.]HMY06155.1 glycerophosphodiester phosphodiesterase [Accumulibacter sp.]HNC16579.1 glycerophosphodiester phosphodiesterase [Accumulibacter sp.]HND79217.1 glycerophosphodiester phosphodiesterase [Accumulibacter sp.]